MEFDLICIKCKNYNIKENNCSAFPNGIPEIIYIGLDDHFEPLPKQGNGIVFLPINKD